MHKAFAVHVCPTLLPGLMWTLSTPASTDAASFDRKGFQTLYSIFSPSVVPDSTLTRFSPYTLSPGTWRSANAD